jgi:hypothetical protein
VTQITWESVFEVCGRVLGTDFDSVARLWLNDKRLKAEAFMGHLETQK